VRTLARVALVGTVLVAPVMATGTAGADEPIRDFAASASASGMSVEYGIPGFIAVEKYIEGGGPTSGAVLESQGSARAFASAPYPGSTFVGYPGLFATVFGSPPPGNGYPLYVSADYPTEPDATAADPTGAISLKATAGPEQSAGDARTGQAADSTPFVSTASSKTIRTANGVEASAVSLTKALALGPLTVASIMSRSTTTYHQGDANPQTATELLVEGGRVGQLGFSFGPKGLAVSQQGVPIPAADGLKARNQALAPAGFAVEISQPRHTEHGSVAAAFELVNTNDVPGAGKGTFRLRFGGAVSQIDLGAAALQEAK
jgi:hypothetical protein